MADVWQSTVSENTEMLVTMGRIEEKLSHLGAASEKAEAANIGFQQTVQNTFAEHATKIGELTVNVSDLNGRVGRIEESVKASFTKSTVTIGLILTGVNVGFGFFGQ